MVHDFKRRAGVLACGIAVLAGVLTACGSGAATGTPAADTRGVRHALGEVTVPTDPERIVALDELAGLAALAAGRTPAVVFASLGDTAAAGILRDAGIEVRAAEVLSLPSAETLAGLTPDLLVGTGADGPAGTDHATLSRVAPTAVLDIEGPWREITTEAAAVFDADAAGARQVAAVERRLAEADRLTGDGDTLALIGFTTETFTMPPHSPSSTLIAEAGFTRPAAEQVEHTGYSAPFSPELLPEHDAGIVVVPDGPGAAASGITGQPLYDRLTGTVVHPVAQQWFGTSPFAFWVIAGDLQALAAGRTDVLRPDAVPASWAEFLAATAAP